MDRWTLSRLLATFSAGKDVVLMKVVAVGLAVCLSLLGLYWRTREDALPEGYEVIRSNSATRVLYRGWDAIGPFGSGQTVLVGPKLKWYDVRERIIVGETMPSPESELADATRPGYFIVEIRNGHTHDGLSRDAYEELRRTKYRGR